MSEEVRDPDVVESRSIGAVAVGSAVIFALSLGAVVILLRPAAAEPSGPAPAVIGSLETTPILDGDRGRHIAAGERAGLTRWRWVDRDAGVVDMPLDLAVDRLLEKDGGAP